MKLKIHKHRGEYIVSLVSALPIGEHLFSGQLSRSDSKEGALGKVLDTALQLEKFGRELAYECLHKLSGNQTDGCWFDEDYDDNS